MRIALAAMTRGGLSGGFRKYLHQIVPLLREEEGVESVHVFAPAGVLQAEHRTWPANDEWRRYAALRQSLRELNPDVLFIPTARFLRVSGIPTVTMVHNMEPLEEPFGGNTLAEGTKNLLRAASARVACHRSDRIVAVSRHVRDFLVTRWQVPERRIGIVYHGADDAFDVRASIPKGLERLEGQQFLFTAGSIRPPRGLEDVIEALAGVRNSNLVIAGSVDRGAEPYARRMRALAEERSVADRIVWAGALSNAEMAWAFRHSAAFVMTSRAEACPLTALEAMAHGAVVVSTDHPPMPEVFGTTARYYRQRDPADLARQLNEVLNLGKEEASAWRLQAVTRARSFSWKAAARETLVELRRALA